MSVVTKGASSATAVQTGWTNPANAEASTGNNVYATAAPAKNGTVSSDFGFAFTLADFGASDVANVAIDQLVVTCEWKVSTTTAATLGVQLRNGATALGTETTFSSTTETDSTQTVTSGVTASDLINGNVVARVRDTRANSNTSHTGSLDFVKLDVTYHLVVVNDDSPSGTLTLGGAATESRSASDSPLGTVSLSGSATDSFSPGSISYTDTPTGTLSLGGSATGSFSHSSSPLGVLSLAGSANESAVRNSPVSGAMTFFGPLTETFTGQAAGGDPIIIQKTGTAGVAVMQKAAVGWTYVTGKTGTSATAVMQKAATGWTQVSGH